MDRILIPGIPLRAHVGVTAEERRTQQEIVVDLVLRLDVATAGITDDIARTVDYEAVCAEVTKLVEARPFHLIEAIAESIAATILESFDVAEVQVGVKKPGALSERGVPYAAVEIRRGRDG